MSQLYFKNNLENFALKLEKRLEKFTLMKEIPTEQDLRFHIVVEIYNLNIQSSIECDEIFLGLESGFESKMNPSRRKKIDLGLFYTFGNEHFGEAIEIKCGADDSDVLGKIKEDPNDYFGNPPGNTIANDLYRLVNYVSEPASLKRVEYYNRPYPYGYIIKNGLFILLYPIERKNSGAKGEYWINNRYKKQILEEGISYWRKKKPELRITEPIFKEITKNQIKDEILALVLISEHK